MNKKNFYNATILNILKDFEDYTNIYIQGSKRVISPELDKIFKFPEVKCLERIIKHYTLNTVLLTKCIKQFDYALETEKFITSMITKTNGRYILNETSNRRKLSKKRKFQNQLVEDLLIIADSKFKLNNVETKRALRLFSYTLNSAFLAAPPSKITKTTFDKLILKMTSEDKTLMLSVYNIIGDYYCNQGRIRKNNFRELNRIIFKLKHY